jgi:hypothetical protein
MKNHNIFIKNPNDKQMYSDLKEACMCLKVSYLIQNFNLFEGVLNI